MKRDIRFTAHAWDDYVFWADTDRKMLTRINRLIEAAAREPFAGVGKPVAPSGIHWIRNLMVPGVAPVE